jgi:glycosyltransferase involved in cell wall biosynthesis
VELLFWTSALLIAYPYAIYPLGLLVTNRLLGRGGHRGDPAHQPTVCVILPVHNEAVRIAAKVRNTLESDYPPERLQVLVIGDGCTDDTLAIAAAEGGNRVSTLALPARAGKAAALNAGLRHAIGDIVVFTDAGTLLDRQSLTTLVAHFADPAIAIVSGEDALDGGGGEGVYARIEMLIRREEARLHSIAGASGCFYGQRRSSCAPFIAGMAPDFLSVLNVVTAGSRAISEPQAVGRLTATGSLRAEYGRKVRTFLRGITALFAHGYLMNPLRYPAFSFILISHKLLRWLAPLPMIACLVSAWLLRAEPLYAVAFFLQVALYGGAALGYWFPRQAGSISLVRLSTFFVLVNLAALKALLLWTGGVRQELWEPTRRPQ